MNRDGPFSRFAHLVRTAESRRELIESYGLLKRGEIAGAIEAISSAWVEAWMAVGEATAIAAKLGRRVDDVNRARAAAGHVQGFARTVKTESAYRIATGSTRPLRDAITALRLTLPEVVIPRPRPLEVRRSITRRGQRTAVMCGAALAFAVFVILWMFVKPQ